MLPLLLVTPIFKQAQEEEEKREHMRHQQAQLQKDTEKRHENVNGSPDSQSQLRDEQSKPKVWMGARMLKEETQRANAQVGKYCDVCTPNGCVCPSTWVNCPNCSYKKESKDKEEHEESDWDAHLKEARDYFARTPMRRHRQSPKVLLFQFCRPPAGWPAGVRPELPPKLDLVTKFKCPEQEQECEYLEPVRGMSILNLPQ